MEFLIIGAIAVVFLIVLFAVDKLMNKESVEEKPVEVQPTSEPKRARTEKGKFKADDPSTPAVNEAWVNGKAPKTKAKKKTVRKKKTIKQTK